MGTNYPIKPVMIQPNAITSARYEYTRIQKDFMIHFIDKMSKYMTKEQEFNKDLFGNIVFEIDLKNIIKTDNYKPMIEAIKDLQKKPISYHYNVGNQRVDVTTTLIATLIHKRGSGKIQITATEASLPVILYLGAGFTSLNKSIALSLPSFYAKRMYELCCRWKDKGFYRVSVLDFRKMMVIEKKFKNNNDMAKNVLDISEKFLTEQADVTFAYTFRKENGSRAFNWLEFNIYPVGGETGEKKSGWYVSLYNLIYVIYRDARAVLVCDFIAEHNELKRAVERFKRLHKDIDSGRIKSHGLIPYVDRVLVDEYEVPAQYLETKEAAAKRKKAEAKIAALKAKKNAAAVRVAAERVVKETKPNTQEVILGLFNQQEDVDKGVRDKETKSFADILGGKK